jgi:large conductance mechanosensitive channel
VLAWGNFITIVINFVIIAGVLFLVVNAMQKLREKEQDEPPPPAPPTRSEVLLEEIRDLLKNR